MNHLVFRVPLKHANKSFYLPFRLCRYVRLFLRKTAAWHRISKLGYYPGIADLPRAVDDLRRARSLPGSSTGTTDNPVQSAFPEDVLGSSTAFAEGIEEITTLEEASSLLLLEELKKLAKEVQISHKNKKELLAALRQSSQTQAGLGRNITNGKLQSQIENRDTHFLRKILDHTGDCIRLSSAPLKLFERVHLVFYRSTEWTEKSLTTIILAKISRKNFPDYVVSQSAAIFSSRAVLLEFEAALRTQFQVDSLLESNGAPTPERLQAVKDLCERVYPRWNEQEQRKEEHYMLSMTSLDGRSEDMRKKHWKKIALETCASGLQDPDCHVIYHYDLQKRIMKLEKPLG